MKITNKAGLPAPLVTAISNDPYSSNGSDITITGLLKPPRAVALERLHEDEITEDVSERIWALMGQLGHKVLERAGPDVSVEKRFFAQVNGWKVSGQADLIPPDLLTDWKFTTVWSCKDGLKPEWEYQLNGLIWLAASNDLEIKRAQIVALYRDWSKLEARRSADYPRSQVQVFDVPVWPLAVSGAWIFNRVQAHQDARNGLPDCTAEERWEKPAKWAIHKDGRERAVKLHDTEVAAKAHLASLDAKHRIEYRPGEQVRCQSYCNARPWCSQADKLGVPKEP